MDAARERVLDAMAVTLSSATTGRGVALPVVGVQASLAVARDLRGQGHAGLVDTLPRIPRDILSESQSGTRGGEVNPEHGVHESVPRRGIHCQVLG
jgi:hypothetical protein